MVNHIYQYLVITSRSGMKQSHCQIRQLKWLLPHYLSTGLVVLAFLWAFTQTKVETSILNFFKVSWSLFKLTKRKLHPFIHNQMPWSNEWIEQNWTCCPKQSMTFKAIGLSNFRMLWWHFELQFMNRQVTHPFLVFGEKINFPIDIQYTSPEQPNKNDVHQFVQQKHIDMQLAHEAAHLHLQAAQLRRNPLYRSKLLGPRYKPGDNLWLHRSVTPKDWVPNFHPPGKVPINFYSVSTTLHIKSKTKRTKKRPSFIMTV